MKFTKLIIWKDGKIHFNSLETDEIRARRFRAKQVALEYPHRIDSKYQVTFFPDQPTKKIVVRLTEEGVGCVCQDIINRYLPCKHIFAAAYILGDKEAIIDIPPPKPINNGGTNKPGKVKFRHIKVGKYFTLLDFLISDSVCKYGIPNYFDYESESGQKVLSLMQLLCAKLLDPLCEEFGRISITRGYLGLELYKQVYKVSGADWPEKALAHGFSTSAGADIWIHKWEDTPLNLAFYLQQETSKYDFDFIRVYPESPILCVGLDAIKQKRIIQEWHPGFRGSTIHKPNSNSVMGNIGEHSLFPNRSK